jgi:hypothetical protein
MKSNNQKTICGSKKTSFVQGVFLVLGSILFAIFIAEMGVRLVYKPNQTGPAQAFKTFVHETVEDLDLLYKPSPGAETTQNGIYQKINSAGFRDREFPIEKTPGTKRIIFLGDSIVYGQDIPLEETIPKQLEKYLIESGEKAEVLNFGVVGYETSQELIRLKTLGLKYKPDIVILDYTLNDCRFASLELNKFNEENKWHVAAPQIKWYGRIPNFFYRNILLLQYLDREKGLFDSKEKWQFYLRGEKDIWHYVRDKNRTRQDAPDSPYRQLESKIVAEAKRLGVPDVNTKIMLDFVGLDNYVMYSSHWNVSKKALAEMQDLANREGFELHVVIVPFLYNLNNYPLWPVHEFLVKEMSEMGISVIDTLEPMKAIAKKYGDNITYDGIHFTRTGADAFGDYLKTELEKKFFPE